MLPLYVAFNAVVTASVCWRDSMEALLVQEAVHAARGIRYLFCHPFCCALQILHIFLTQQTALSLPVLVWLQIDPQAMDHEDSGADGSDSMWHQQALASGQEGQPLGAADGAASEAAVQVGRWFIGRVSLNSVLCLMVTSRARSQGLLHRSSNRHPGAAEACAAQPPHPQSSPYNILLFNSCAGSNDPGAGSQAAGGSADRSAAHSSTVHATIPQLTCQQRAIR